MDELIVATDFSGLGSPEEALKRLQVKHSIAFACDKDKYVKQSYLANHNPDIFYDDITTRDQSKTAYSDVYCFGFPCQAFSIAGNQLGFEDTRGTLVFNSASYIREKQPRVFIAENVKGLLSHDKPKKSKSKYGRTFGAIRDLFGCTVNGQINLYKYKDCLNYHIFFKVFNSTDYGIPQNRERIFIIGFRDEADAKSFKFPAKFPLKYKLMDFLQKESVDEKYYLSETAIKRLIRRENYIPQINPQITGTINTKNNSPQLSFDNGTTLIVTNNHGQRSLIMVSKEVFFVKENTSKGFAEAYPGDSINFSNPNSKTRRGRIGKQIAQTIDTACNQAVLLPLFGTESNSQGNRVYDEKGISVTLSSQAGGGGTRIGLYLIGKRIRRLTPKEVFALFGYSEEFYEICRALNSDTQLYKQGGNSIVVDTIMWILVEVCRALNIPYVEPEMR